MPHADDPTIRDDLDPQTQLCHDLTGSLTTISGRAQLLTRVVRRSATLADGDRERLVNGLGAIEDEVVAMVARLGALSCAPPDDAAGGE